MHVYFFEKGEVLSLKRGVPSIPMNYGQSEPMYSSSGLVDHFNAHPLHSIQISRYTIFQLFMLNLYCGAHNSSAGFRTQETFLSQLPLLGWSWKRKISRRMCLRIVCTTLDTNLTVLQLFLKLQNNSIRSV